MSQLQEPLLDQLLAPLGDCLTIESARRVLALRPTPDVQAKVDYLAERANAGELTSDERDDYEAAVRAGNFIAILKAKARHLLLDRPAT